MPSQTETVTPVLTTTTPPRRRGAPRRRVPWGELVVVVVLVLLLLLPLPANDLQLVSQLNHVVTVLGAALSVYVMMRLKLLHFGVPAFMAIGAYAAALTGLHLTPNLVVMVLASLAVPAVAAVPFGLITMRLRGTYFALVTFLIGQVVYLLIVATEALGGTDGLPGLPAPTWGDVVLADQVTTMRVGVGVALLAVLLVIAFTAVSGRALDSLRSNEVLAGSLGLRDRPVRLGAFVVAAAVAGLSGFLVVNTLTTAHPSSFSVLSGVDYVAYVVVGGWGSVLGPAIGTALLVLLTSQFASEGTSASALLGGLLILTSLFLQRGLTGTVAHLVATVRRRRGDPRRAGRNTDDDQR